LDNVFHFHGPILGMNSGTLQIRGYQISKYFKGSTVDNNDYFDGVNIYIKIIPYEFIPDICYCDVVDNYKVLRRVSNYSEIGVIVLSKIGFDYARRQLGDRNIKLIPQHHCNKNRIIRPDRLVKTVGFIGSSGSCQLSFLKLRKSFLRIGLNFIWMIPPYTLKQVINFYQSIDIQIVYRIWDRRDRNVNLKDGLKLFNAGSFGIPTVSTSEPGYDEEYKDLYLKVNSPSELIEKCLSLKKNNTFYNDLQGKLLDKAEDHHIDKILPLYKELLQNG
jgi:hypothetical protein